LSNCRPWLVGLLVLCASGLWGLDFVTEGEKQLSQDNPSKALTYLEAALAQGVPDERLLLNLGLAYQRTGQSADARKTFRQGADLAGPGRKTFLLNLGIASFLAKDWAAADEAYTSALALDPAFAEALLNRANARLSLQDWTGAAADYRTYQAAAPANPQKDKIDQVIALLEQTAVESAATKLAEETRKKKEEEDRNAKEAAALADQQKSAADAEAARQKALADAEAQRKAAADAAEAERKKQEEILAKIRESLADASDDSKTLSTGPSSVKADDGDFSLEP